MKLNFKLIVLAAISIASTLPSVESKTVNPYLNCTSGDVECRNTQYNLCRQQYSDCKKETPYDVEKCNQLHQYCKEVSDLKGVPMPEEEYDSEYDESVLPYAFEPIKSNVRILGRANYIDGYLWFGLTNSGIEYMFTGKSTVINVTADSAAFSEDTPARIHIYTDGKLYLDTVITEKITNFAVNFEKKGKHTVRFIKVSEAERGSIRINEIRSDATKLIPTKPAKKLIEFIGDSITCAYGVDGTLADTFSTRTEDGTKSYAVRTARKFNADYSIVAFSGFAILSCYSFDGGRTPDSTVPPIYDKLGFSFTPNVFDDGTYYLQTTNWDQSQYNPDLIVINLGTNDDAYFNSIDPSLVPGEKEAFVEEYVKFLTNIRRIYPSAEILCTLGMMGQDVFPLVEQSVNNYTAASGDKHVNVYKFNVQNSDKNGYATDGHPSVQSHVDAAHELIETIETLYNWKADPNVNIEAKV